MFEINNIFWRIKFVNPDDLVLLNFNNSYTLGSCDNVTKTIYLSRVLSGHLLKKVLCHELVHAAMFSYNVNLNIEQEEILADIITTYGEEIINVTNKVFKKLQLYY